jgi:hypothetical protein
MALDKKATMCNIYTGTFRDWTRWICRDIMDGITGGKCDEEKKLGS